FCILCFFFQAEDGIRDRNVTGVQTCALPICGKSTLLYLIAGIEQASSGEIKLENKTINQPGPDRVVVFQSDGLFPWMTVLENVMYGLKIKKTPQNVAYKKAEETLKMDHLGKYLNSYQNQLSGGMKQRV